MRTRLLLSIVVTVLLRVKEYHAVTGTGRGSVQLECVLVGEVPILVELVADRGVDGGELLQSSHPLDASTAGLGGEHRPEPVPLEAQSVVADVDPAFVQKTLDVQQRERETDVIITAGQMILGLVLK